MKRLRDWRNWLLMGLTPWVAVPITAWIMRHMFLVPLPWPACFGWALSAAAITCPVFAFLGYISDKANDRVRRRGGIRP